MRPIAAMKFPGLIPGQVGKDVPEFVWIDPAKLLVDETYQRELSRKSLDLISRIITKWDWARMKPPVWPAYPAGEPFARLWDIAPASAIAAGRVMTQASAMERTVLHCRPEPLAAMVPATPDDNMWVVDTGTPMNSAPKMVAAATSSAAAP